MHAQLSSHSALHRPWNVAHWKLPNELQGRPPNDEQVADAVLKGMRRAKISNAGDYLAEREPLTENAADSLRTLFDFDVDTSIPQRKAVHLGRGLAKAVALGAVIGLADRGYPDELITQAIDSLRGRIREDLAGFHAPESPVLVQGAHEAPSWLRYVGA